jgi:hypothetical protein
MFTRYNKKMQLVEKEVYQGKPAYATVEQREFYALCRLIIDARILRGTDPRSVRLYGDKTPQYYNYFDSLKHLYPEAKFINVIRDPRDIAVSRLHHMARIGVADILQKGSKARAQNIAQSVENCLNCHRKTVAAQQKYSGDLMEIRYEDLIADTYSGVAEMMNFLGVPKNESIFQRMVSMNSFSSVTNRIPGQMDETSFLRKGIVGDWRNELSQDEANFIAFRCAEIHRYF